MKKTSLTLLFFITGLMSLQAKSIDLPDEKMHFDIPDDWVSSQVAGATFYATNAENTTVCVLVSLPNDDQEGLDQPTFINGFKDGMLKKMAGEGGTAQITHEGPLTIQGVPFYLYQGIFSKTDGKTLNFHAYATAVNGKIYSMVLESLDANTDAQLEAVANSLTFQGTPVLPDPSLRKDDRAEKYGQVVGYLIGLLAMVAIIRTILRRGRKNASAD